VVSYCQALRGVAEITLSYLEVRACAIKRAHCPGNEERAARARERKNDTYQRRKILIYYCVFMIPIPIISILEIY